MKNVFLLLFALLFFASCNDDPVSPQVEFKPQYYPEIGEYVLNERINPRRTERFKPEIQYIDSAYLDGYNLYSLFEKVKNDDPSLPLDSKGRWYISKFKLTKNTFVKIKKDNPEYGVIMAGFTPVTGELIDSEYDSIYCYILPLIRSIDVNGSDTIFNAETWQYIEYFY